MNNKNFFIVIKTDNLEDGVQNMELLLANNDNIEEMLLTAKQFTIDSIKELLDNDYYQDTWSYEYFEEDNISLDEIKKIVKEWKDFYGTIFFINWFHKSYEITISIFSEYWKTPTMISETLLSLTNY